MIQLSVIIPTRNRCQSLKGVLESIVTQSFPKENFEVIVVDNGSTDDTRSVVDEFSGQLNMQYHFDDRPGLHNGRHDGMRLSHGDILVFADDDIEALPTWLEGITESFQDKSVVLVGGKILPKYEEQPPFWILEKWYQLCEYGHCLPELSLIDFGEERREIPAQYVFGCNFSIRKQILHSSSGFHPDGMPFELIQYRGDGETYVSNYITEHHLKTIYNPLASVYHLVPTSRLTIDYFKKRAFCQGVEMSYIDKRYKTNNNPTVKRGGKISKWFRIITGLETYRQLKTIQNKPSLTEIEKQISQSYSIGYQYHDTLYHSDKSLHEWVHQNNYL